MANTALAFSGRPSLVLIVLAVFAVLIGAAATLWAYYGTAVFFEMIVVGLAYCF